MIKVLYKFCLTCIMIFMAIVYSVSASEGDIEAGKLIFNSNCAACHAGGKNVLVSEKTLELNVLQSYEMDSVDKITKQVTYGKNAMPAFGDRLSDDDINNVANYVLNQAGQGW